MFLILGKCRIFKKMFFHKSWLSLVGQKLYPGTKKKMTIIEA